MKNAKLKIKKLRLPIKKMQRKEKDYVAIVLEDVNSNFRAFGEALDFVRNKTDATFEEVGRIRERLDSMEIKLDEIQEEVARIKAEIQELRPSLNKKADIEKLEKLDLRIKRIEKHLGFEIA